MKYIPCFVAAIICVGLIAFSGYTFYQIGYHNAQIDTLPSQSEVQEILGVPVDGWIGPESRKAWNEYIERRTCDEYARPIMEQFNKDFNRLYEN